MVSRHPTQLPSRDDLLRQLGRAVVESQDATDAFDQAVAELRGISRSDLRCLGILEFWGPMTAGELADRSALTPGAITGVLDRLEARGYARRLPDATDRRRVLATTTPLLRKLNAETYGPLADEGNAQIAATYSDDQLRLLVDFLNESRDLQHRHAARIRALDAAP